MTGVTLAELSTPQVKEYGRAALAELNSAAAAGLSPAAARPERQMIGADLRMYLFRGAGFYAIVASGEPAGLIAATRSKRAAGPWGRYVNVYLVHTLIAHRCRGYAKAAYRAVAEAALEDGCARLTTTAATVGGWRVHRSLDWPAWGLNPAGQIVTDADLTGAGPPGLPDRCSRLRTPGRPLTKAEHAAALTDPQGPYRLAAAALPADYRTAAAE